MNRLKWTAAYFFLFPVCQLDKYTHFLWAKNMDRFPARNEPSENAESHPLENTVNHSAVASSSENYISLFTGQTESAKTTVSSTQSPLPLCSTKLSESVTDPMRTAANEDVESVYMDLDFFSPRYKNDGSSADDLLDPSSGAPPLSVKTDMEEQVYQEPIDCLSPQQIDRVHCISHQPGFSHVPFPARASAYSVSSELALIVLIVRRKDGLKCSLHIPARFLFILILQPELYCLFANRHRTLVKNPIASYHKV